MPNAAVNRVPRDLLHGLIVTSRADDPTLPDLVCQVLAVDGLTRYSLMRALLRGPYREENATPPTDLIAAAVNSDTTPLLRWALTHPSVPPELAAHRLRAANVDALAGLIEAGQDDAMVETVVTELARRCPDPAAEMSNDAGAILTSRELRPEAAARIFPLTATPQLDPHDYERFLGERRTRDRLLVQILHTQPAARPFLLGTREVAARALRHIPHLLSDADVRQAAAALAASLRETRAFVRAHTAAAATVAHAELESIGQTVELLLEAAVGTSRDRSYDADIMVNIPDAGDARRDASRWKMTSRARERALRTIGRAAAPLARQAADFEVSEADLWWLLLLARYAARPGRGHTPAFTDQLRGWAGRLRDGGGHPGSGVRITSGPSSPVSYTLLTRIEDALNPPETPAAHRSEPDRFAAAGDDLAALVAGAALDGANVDDALAQAGDPQAVLVTVAHNLRHLTSGSTPDGRARAAQRTLSSRFVTDSAALALPAHAALHADNDDWHATEDGAYAGEAPPMRVARLLRAAFGADLAAWARFWSAPISHAGDCAWLRLGEVIDAASSGAPWPDPPPR